jgi:hypothetical protein
MLSSYLSNCEIIVPGYEALSYTWGTMISCSPVFVGGYPLQVTESLDVTLRHLREATQSRRLWIDALCINQEDVLERNSLILLMDCIYGRARETVVWLSPTADNSDLLLDRLAKGYVPDSEALQFGYYMYKLTSRPWWTRVWM